ncbi:MAG: DUF5671 domain-containing protein [Chloroflexi bacterium]|nr:DUF5671 domain-containing protein [Chloroflexota bacterium]
MDTVRRIYLYVMSAVSLGVLLYGLQVLLTVVLHALGLRGGTPVFGDEFGDRRALSLAIALVGVGLPVWGIHWWFVERSVRRAADAEGERRSGIRAFFLAAVLAVLALVAAQAAMSLIRFVLDRVVPNSEGFFGYVDLGATLATLVVVGAAWAVHARTRLTDVAGGELRHEAAWLPRAYRYLVAFVGLVAFVEGVGQLAALLVDYLAGTPEMDEFSGVGLNYTFMLFSTLPSLVVGLLAWVSHAWASNRIAARDNWHGASERASRLGLAYWPLVIGVAAIAVIAHATDGLEALFGQVLAAVPDSFDVRRSLAASIATSVVTVVPWLAIWWFHRAWGRDAASATGDPGRAVLADRLERHVSAGVGLAFGAVAGGWLVGILIDVVLGGNRALGDAWRSELAQYLAWAILGLALWIWHWSRLLAHRGSNPSAEAASAVRRTYLLLAIGVAIVSTLGSLGIVLYRLVGYLLGAGLGGNAVSELSTPLGALVVAGLVVIYHGLQLRSDRGQRPAPADAAPSQTAPEVAAAKAAATVAEAAMPNAAAPAGRTLVLRGPDGADLAATLTMLRGTLPEGQTLDDA